jgi:hypothetical protein
MHEVTIHNVSPELFDNLKGAVLGKFGGKALGSGNELDVSGVRATYSYDAKANALTVGVLSTPALVTAGHVLGQLYDALGRMAVKPAVKLPA